MNTPAALPLPTLRRAYFWAGFCFIAAAITSIAGKLLYAPVLQNANYLGQGSTQAGTVLLGVLFELLLAASAMGTALSLYPVLKTSNSSLAIGYVVFRLLEVVFIVAGLLSVLGLISLSSAFAAATIPDVAAFETTGAVLKALHDWTFILGPNFMLGINTFIYSYVFYHSRTVPRPLAILGLLAAVFIFIASLLELFGIIKQVSAPGFLLALPIFVYEMTLAVTLLVKQKLIKKATHG
ncbi:MAG: DUF4386 domain-containing protein [Bacteroidetes bacterium]|nr:DUF4386 domain-containing protein [Bacteroidota bacterium]